ncbi:MAG: 2-oxo acid dehydrogenase subunit E2 [Lachnospiraceae bacterium]|nr:2-oxo acid dehydrogenase subunit E2 [Candidatus Equihabitans merdae]
MAEKKHKLHKNGGYRPDDVTGLQKLMCHLWPNRTDCEVCLFDTFDCTEVVRYLEEKNASHPDYKTTIFHATIVAVARMVLERPLMNRFVQGRRIYQREDVSLSFTAKRRFADGAEESLMTISPRPDDTLDTISKHLYGDIHQMRKSDHGTDGIDGVINSLMSLPLPLQMLIVKVVRLLDFWGLTPKALKDGDPHYTSVLLSNLGSIKCPAVYHHLTNYGTQSIMITIGTLRKEQVMMPDGTMQVRVLIDVTATLDERIGDGFYFARSLKLIKHIFAHPELLDLPMSEPSGFDYK